VEALAGLVIAIGRLIRAAPGRIASIDLNPVMVGAVGEGAIVVDGLVESEAPAPQPTMVMQK
jgi:hypothetical protein